MKAWKTTLAALSLAACFTATILADSPAEMLEKGIYNENTIGNLVEAIKIYRKVVSAAGKTQAVAAKAQFRLGQCLLKQGKKSEATDAFQAIISNFPNQKKIVAQAKQQLPDQLRLLKAPWKDGERLTLTMRLGGGRVLGLIGLSVDSEKLDGEDVWHMNIRRFVDSGNNEGVSEVWAQKLTHRPRKTIFDHTMLGKSTGTWTNDKLNVTMIQQGVPKKSEHDLDGVTYSNDQVFYGFRQLPLEIGYEATLQIRVAFTGGTEIGLEVSVKEKETIKTPAGTFDCFRINTNINQTFWVADVPERYVAQFDAGGVIAQLTTISDGKSQKIENDDLGFSCTVPAGWFHIPIPSKNKKTKGGVQLVAQDMASANLYFKAKSLMKDDGNASLQANIDSKIDKLESVFEDFELDSRGIQKTKLAGVDALAIRAQHKSSNLDYVFGMTLGLSDDQGIQLTTAASKAQAKRAQPAFDAIRKSIKLR